VVELKKEYIFLNGLPRSGNTLLSVIINQNPKINITSNTILADVMYRLHLLRDTDIYKNFPDEKSLNNILKNIFNNYYKHWKSKFIIDRGPWGTPGNLEVLKSIIKKPKFIILYRPVIECLASFVKIERPVDVELRCEQLINNDGIIGKNLWGIKNIIESKEDYIIIKYLDLVNNPLDQINKIYRFLNIDTFNHKLENINQFSINDVTYNDSVLNGPLHKIRTDKIKLNQYKIEDYLPKKVINKYSSLEEIYLQNII